MNELVNLNPRDLYSLLDSQVKAYHKHYRMGSNSSVPAETARELLESMIYTLCQPGASDLESGQAILAEKLRRAKELCRLVRATAPDWESQCRWDAAAALDAWLCRYDHLFFAHRSPEFWDYPLLCPIPETLRGIDWAIFYLNGLWLENQLLHAMGSAARGDWENGAPAYWDTPLNICEQPLIQLLGRQLLGLDLSSSDLTDDHQQALLPKLHAPDCLYGALSELCRRLNLTDPNVEIYARYAVDQLLPRLAAALPTGDLSHIFL